MSFLMRQVAHCDVCGHEWLTNKVPSHCAKCKSRKWNKSKPVNVCTHCLGTGLLGNDVCGWCKGTSVDILNGFEPAITVSKRPQHSKTCKCLMCKPPK